VWQGEAGGWEERERQWQSERTAEEHLQRLRGRQYLRALPLQEHLQGLRGRKHLRA
jgi:hypothetical protein